MYRTGVGFTGTRKGMTPKQSVSLLNILSDMIWIFGTDFHEGEAVGSDLEAKAIAQDIGFNPVPYPAGKDPLARNRTIVESCMFLLATPDSFSELLRSGTWMTIRYANSIERYGLIIWPDGNISHLTETHQESRPYNLNRIKNG